MIEVNEGPAFGEYTTAAVADGAATFARDLVAALVALAEEAGQEKLEARLQGHHFKLLAGAGV